MATLEMSVNVVPRELTEIRYMVSSSLKTKSAIQPWACLTDCVCVLVSCLQGDPGRPGRSGPSGPAGDPGPKVNWTTGTGIAVLCWT